MGLRVDPERNEVTALQKVARWRGRRVLEVGCGEGRLTLRLAGLGAHVEALDADPGLIRTARRALPARYADRVRYRTGGAERLLHPNGGFDRVVFAWSL